MKELVDLLAPTCCVVCRRGEMLLCDACLRSFNRIRSPLCARCGAPTAWPVERCGECAGRRLAFRSARAAVVYAGPVRSLVAAWKERGLRRLGEQIVELVVETVERPSAQAVSFVPGDRERTLWRGHNTSEALAHALAARWGASSLPLLTRARRTPRQRGLTRSGRRANVRGSFRALRAAPARVVLVDDVYTTGATVSAAASELRRAGARTVDVVTFARAVRG